MFCQMVTFHENDENHQNNEDNSVARLEKWDVSQMGFRGRIASGGCIVLLPGACWAHGASKTANLDASLLLCTLQYFRAYKGMAWHGMLQPGACRTSRASTRRIQCGIVSCRDLYTSSPKSHLCPLPHNA